MVAYALKGHDIKKTVSEYKMDISFAELIFSPHFDRLEKKNGCFP